MFVGGCYATLYRQVGGKSSEVALTGKEELLPSFTVFESELGPGTKTHFSFAVTSAHRVCGPLA